MLSCNLSKQTSSAQEEFLAKSLTLYGLKKQLGSSVHLRVRSWMRRTYSLTTTMATVHPSRMGLVPQEKPKKDGSRHPENIGSGSRDRYNERRDRPPHQNRSRSNDRGRRDRSEDDERRREKSEERNTFYEGGSRNMDSRSGRRDEERERRRSPDYSAYRRPSPPHLHSNGHDGSNGTNNHDINPPWRAPENMYASRRGGHGGEFSTGGDYFSSRQQQRANSTVTIWPPSPKAPVRDDSPSRKHRSSKRRRSVSSDSDSEDERERRRRKKKEKKRREKDRDRDDKDSRRKHHRDRSESETEDRERRREKERRHRRDRSESKDRDDRRRRRSRSDDNRGESIDSERRGQRKDDRRSKSRRATTPPRSGEEEDMWVEKQPGSFVADAAAGAPPDKLRASSSSNPTIHASEQARDDESSDDELGPKPANYVSNSKQKVDERAYGGALLRGEGSAMAAFLQGDTDARIPRRGEIGLTPDEIANFEAVGYVMSGSRHRRMNAVRMRKENQVISAEEKRGILKLQKEERERREAILRDEFKELVSEKLKTAGVGPMP
ncbi:DUF926-domain-containing protein [Schizopora paradoxa]|uniref:DUF926-domain-containing protein n=1 Tax=Schizopora paradoxa TaxID=27342 RepID=A0A0H2S319_9AGAM|nr:DUF926-domain-containing protein [Schizopora paradoxa]